MKQETVIIIEDFNKEMEVVIRYKGKGNFEIVKAHKKVNLDDFSAILQELSKPNTTP